MYQTIVRTEDVGFNFEVPRKGRDNPTLAAWVDERLHNWMYVHYKPDKRKELEPERAAHLERLLDMNIDDLTHRILVETDIDQCYWV